MQFLKNCIKLNEHDKIFDEKHYDITLCGYSNIWVEHYNPIFLIFKDNNQKQSKRCKYEKLTIKCHKHKDKNESHLYLYHFNNLSKKVELIEWLYFDKSATEDKTIFILTKIQS